MSKNPKGCNNNNWIQFIEKQALKQALFCVKLSL